MHKKLKFCTVCFIFGRTVLRRLILFESANPYFRSGIERAERRFRALSIRRRMFSQLTVCGVEFTKV